jgi:hypothetical protein
MVNALLKLIPFCWLGVLSAQVITTVVGTNWSFPATPLAARNAPMGAVSGLAVDTQGNVYIADMGTDRVMLVSTDGTLTIAAGNGIVGYSGDGGPATSAALNFPSDLTSVLSPCISVDRAGDLYIADVLNKRVRRVSRGIIATVAGNGMYGFSGDGGPAISASLEYPSGWRPTHRSRLRWGLLLISPGRCLSRTAAIM